MSLLNCLDLSQQIAKLILQKRYKQKVDMNFNIECNMIRKKWNAHGDNNLAIQFYLKKQMKSYLVEEWNILSNQQQVNESAQNFIEKCLEMTYQTPLQKKSDNEIDHILHLNETKKSDWLDPEQIATLQVTLNQKLTVNVAFLQKYDLIEQVASESINEFKSFKRDRFLSDDYHNEQGINANDIKETRVRKTSYHDLESLRQYKKNQAVITQARHRVNDSFSSTSSRNKSNQLLTIINKKDDVEILSSAEDAQKIIDQDENGDFEIQMIIDEQPVEKGQTIIINQKMSPITNLILKIREKKHQYSSQLFETLSFIKNYT